MTVCLFMFFVQPSGILTFGAFFILAFFPFLGATKHLYNWLCPLVCRVTHSFDDPHVAPYWPTWPCSSANSFGFFGAPASEVTPFFRVLFVYDFQQILMDELSFRVHLRVNRRPRDELRFQFHFSSDAKISNFGSVCTITSR